MIIWVSISTADALAINKYCNNSLSLFLADPSAILEGIETAALRSWFVRPKISSLGNFLLIRYIKVTNSTERFQTSKSLCVFTCVFAVPRPLFLVPDYLSLVSCSFPNFQILMCFHLCIRRSSSLVPRSWLLVTGFLFLSKLPNPYVFSPVYSPFLVPRSLFLVTRHSSLVTGHFYTSISSNFSILPIYSIYLSPNLHPENRGLSTCATASVDRRSAGGLPSPFSLFRPLFTCPSSLLYQAIFFSWEIYQQFVCCVSILQIIRWRQESISE